MRCGKTTYADRTTAKRASKDLGRMFGRRYRAYLCPQCSQWHLTTARVIRETPVSRRPRRGADSR